MDAQLREGIEYLGTIEAPVRTMLAEAWERARRAAPEVANEKEIHWINLGRQPDGGEVVPIEGIEILDEWVVSMLRAHYPDDWELDGYGFHINPIGCPSQPWHLDYGFGSSVVFVPLTPFTVHNATQYVALPPRTPDDVILAAVEPGTERVDFDHLVEHTPHLSVRQLLAKPFSVLRINSGTVHRGITNTGDHARVMFFFAVLKRGSQGLDTSDLIEGRTGTYDRIIS